MANKAREYFVLKRCSSSDIFGFHSREVFIICMNNGTGKIYSYILQSSVEGFLTNFRVTNAEESILSRFSGDKFGLELQYH